jgi:hypothetical protein
MVLDARTGCVAQTSSALVTGQAGLRFHITKACLAMRFHFLRLSLEFGLEIRTAAFARSGMPIDAGGLQVGMA